MTLFDANGNYLMGAEISLATIRGNRIINERRRPRPPVSMEAAKNMVLDHHPTAEVRSLSSVYNCMGMVFACRRTFIDIEHLEEILEEDEYTRVDDVRELKRGDIVVYRDDAGRATHVGIVCALVYDIRSGDISVSVLSQWGADGEYFHEVKDVNVRLGSPAEYWTDRK